MLHEILLSLSGISSPIWVQKASEHDKPGSGIHDYVSPSEQSMLAELAQLSYLHADLQRALTSVQNRHPSPICRAVGSSMSSKHLGAFRKKITDIEESILSKDTKYVGGYEIVPLSTLVTDFAPWTRRLRWLLKAAKFMSHSDPDSEVEGRSGAALLNFLDAEKHTGYSSIQTMASELLIVGQIAWMRSVSFWVLYGEFPTFGLTDFMIQSSSLAQTTGQCLLSKDHIPGFVTPDCASSILSAGNAIIQSRKQEARHEHNSQSDTLMTLLPKQASALKKLVYPLNPDQLEVTMNGINKLISQNALSQLLPVERILEVSNVIQSYLLLGRGEFAVTLIENVDDHLSKRNKLFASTGPVRKLGRPDSIALKDSELSTVLTKTWSDLAALQNDLESEDKIFISAKKLLKLSVLGVSQTSYEAGFISKLAPNPTLLRLDIPTASPLNLYLSSAEITKYSQINAHLLSLRRCQMHLSGLWKLSSHRRCHPNPLAPPASGTAFGKHSMEVRRQREARRSAQTRCHWSTMSNILFVINEFNSYLHGEVIRCSWEQLLGWLTKSLSSSAGSASAREFAMSPSTTFTSGAIKGDSGADSPQHHPSVALVHDPRAMAQAHKSYLNSLYSALLIDKQKFNQCLDTLLSLVDHFIALFSRLQTVWQGLDLQEDDGIVDAFMNYAQDETDLLAEMNRSRDESRKTTAQLIGHLKDIERARGVNDLAMGVASIGMSTDADGKFVPWSARTLDKLIMKLDFLQGGNGHDVSDLADDAEAGINSDDQ